MTITLEDQSQNIMKKGSISGHQFCQLNHSPSKMSYSFTKQTRFRIPKLETSSSFYDIPSRLNNRSTGFGYGNKSTIVLPTLKNPSPDYYQIEDELLVHQKSKKGSIFGESRDRVKYGSLNRKDKIPGPGEYEISKSSLTSVNFTMKGDRSHSIYKQDTTPGPGQYESCLTNKEGYSVVSAMKNSRVKINPCNQRKSVEGSFPGPGSYSSEALGVSKGSYMFSKVRDTEKCIFPRALRNIGVNKENSSPGPGSYSTHSQFSRR